MFYVYARSARPKVNMLTARNANERDPRIFFLEKLNTVLRIGMEKLFLWRAGGHGVFSARVPTCSSPHVM